MIDETERKIRNKIYYEQDNPAPTDILSPIQPRLSAKDTSLYG